MKKLFKFTIMVVVMMILVFTMSSQTLAATTVSVCDGLVTITDNDSKGAYDESTNTYTVTAEGTLMSKKTNTITITNTDKIARIGFDFSSTKANSITINGATASASGSFSAVVEKGKSIEIKLQSKAGTTSNRKATLTLTNITHEVLPPSNVTVGFNSVAGTVTAAGVAVADGETITVEAEGMELVATAGTDARFIAWVDEEGAIKSHNSVYKILPDVTGTVTALFSKDTPYFMVDDTYMFSDLNKAASKGTKLILVCDGTLPAGEYVIPAGTTLLIPFDAANTMYTTKPEGVNGYVPPTVYRTLTLASGANITVNGAISISAKQASNIGNTASPTEKYGLVTMKEGSTITVNNGGKLYVWGYIAGSGSITAKSGATVYEDFQVKDWRGGNATTTMIDENSNKVFPMSQYYVQNIQVPLTLEAGAVENGYMSVFISGGGILDAIEGSEIPFIGPSGMFRINEGSITKDYDENTDRLVIDVNGTLEMSKLSLSMRISLIGSATIDSSKYVLPINGNITLNVNAGSQVNVSQEMALLPGGEINVYKGAKCTFTSGAKAYIYDSENWGGYCSQYNSKLIPVNYAHGRLYTRKEADLVDAKVYVEGEVDAYEGFVYTTAAGANVYGAEGGLVRIKSDTGTAVTYQATQNNTNISYQEIPVTTANLKNSDGTYIDPEVLADCCSTYVVSAEGKWTPQNPSHTEVTVPAVEPTCTEAGKTEGSYCSVCNTVIKEQEAVAALGHSYGDWTKVDDTNHSKSCVCGDVITEGHNWDAGVVTTPATHTATGVKTYTCSVCSATKTETIEKLSGHTYGNWTKVDDTNHSKSCVCGDVITEGHNWNAGVVTTPATHTATGVKTYTCTVCSATKTETIEKLSGHTYGNWTKVDDTNHSKSCVCGDVITEGHNWNAGVVTTPATHTATGVKTYTCSVCSATKTETIEKLSGHTYGNWTKVDDTNHSKSCVCGDVITEGHNWDAGVVTTPATCKATGIKTFICSECSGTKTEDIPVDADNHTFVGINCSACGLEKIVTSTTYTISDGNIIINTSLVTAVSDDTQITIATFDTYGRLLSIVQATAANLKETTMSSAGVKFINVYAWDGVKVMTPISGVEKIEL